MPIYEYRCDNGHTFEVMQSFSDDALSECIECGAPARRVLHSPAIHFKGSGFHNTDYGTRSRNKAKEAAGEGSGGDSGGGSGGGSGSDGGGDSGSGGSGSSGSGSGGSASKNETKAAASSD